MSDSNRTAQPFAYILIVEPDDAARDLIQQTVRAPNCVVDLARDEDEAVSKALQRRPQLIIVKEHSPLHVDELHPPSVSVASRICRRARLSRSVRVVTHSDASITLRWHIWPSTRTFPDNPQRGRSLITFALLQDQYLALNSGVRNGTLIAVVI